MTDGPARIRADVRSRSGTRNGQAMVETVVVMFFLCLVFFLGYEYANLFTAHTVVNYAAARAARARAVGFNDFMVTKTIRVATAGVAGACRSHNDGGDDLSAWLNDALSAYQQAGTVALTIPHRHRTGREVAVHLRQTTASLVQALVQARAPEELIVEGGATAFAILSHLGLTALSVVGQLAPGVVCLETATGMRITLKPGSYRWAVQGAQFIAGAPATRSKKVLNN